MEITKNTMATTKRAGNSRTQSERRASHTQKFGKGSVLPPRGTGLRKKLK